MSKIFGNFIKLGGSILGQIVGQFGRGADRQIAERAKIWGHVSIMWSDEKMFLFQIKR